MQKHITIRIRSRVVIISIASTLGSHSFVFIKVYRYLPVLFRGAA